MTMEIATALLPVFFVLTLGYGAGKAHLVDNRHVGGLNTLVMSIALPISLFTTLASGARAQVIARWPLAAIGLVVMGLVYAGTYVLERRAYGLTPAEAAVQAITVAFPNLAAVGLPLAGSALGGNATLSVAAVLAVGAITLSPVTIMILERAAPADGTRRPLPVVVADSLRKPVVVGPVLGLVWSLAGFGMPEVLRATLTEIGSVTAGVALFLTGLVLSAQPIEFTRNAFVSTFLTVVVRPALALLALWMAGLTGALAGETLLLLAVPAGFFGVLLGIGFSAKVPVAGTTLLFSTVLSAVTLSFLIAVLPQL